MKILLFGLKKDKKHDSHHIKYGCRETTIMIGNCMLVVYAKHEKNSNYTPIFSFVCVFLLKMCM